MPGVVKVYPEGGPSRIIAITESYHTASILAKAMLGNPFVGVSYHEIKSDAWDEVLTRDELLAYNPGAK